MIYHVFSLPIPLGPIDFCHDHSIRYLNPLLEVCIDYQIDSLLVPVSLITFFHSHLNIYLVV